MNANAPRIDANKIVYPELSYKLMGILFKVQNGLGSHYQEKYYQRAIESALEEDGIKFEREKMVPLLFNGKSVGRYFIDFVIDGKIALEVKTIDFFSKREWNQVKAYLKSANLRMGLLVNFNGERLIYKRILNSELRGS